MDDSVVPPFQETSIYIIKGRAIPPTKIIHQRVNDHGKAALGTADGRIQFTKSPSFTFIASTKVRKSRTFSSCLLISPES